MAARTDRLDLIERALALPIKPARRKLVMVTMAKFANPDGSNCFPGIDRIAGVTGFDRREIKRDIRDLEKMKWISPYANTSGGRGKTKIYQLNIPVSKGQQMPLDLSQENGGAEPTLSETKRVGKMRAKGWGSRAQKGGENEFPIRNTSNYQIEHNHKPSDAPLAVGHSSAGECDGKEPKTDARFRPFVDVLYRYHKAFAARLIGFDLWFGEVGGRQLKNLLKKYPTLDEERFTRFVANRARSPGVKHAQPAGEWLSFILDFTTPKGQNGYVNKRELADKELEHNFAAVAASYAGATVAELPVASGEIVPRKHAEDGNRTLGGRPFAVLAAGRESGD